MSGKLRVSFIEYLNSVPLGWEFLEGPRREGIEILFDVPSECARRVAAGQADVGLIPVVEYQRIPDLLVLPGISIASKREVKSVLFASKMPLSEVSRVAVDLSSRTSVALLRIIFQTFLGRADVTFHEEAPNPKRMLDLYDAALVIGNPALQLRGTSYYVHDLACEWHRFTGLPFVFAFWAVRRAVDLGEHVEVFYRSRERGLEQVDRIAQKYSGKLNLPCPEIRSYLLENLDYSLDEANLKGLETFFSLSADLGLIPAARPLEFYPEPI